MKQSRKIFNNETMRGIGARLREVRGDRTLAEFAEKLGVGRSTLSNYEAGRRQPNHEFIERLCELEDLRPDYFLPNLSLEPQMVPMSYDNWWAYVPALWLYSYLQKTHKFKNDRIDLLWWSRIFPALISELDHRVFDLAEKGDLELGDAAFEICRLLEADGPDELFKFVASLDKE